ncbi:hypothetical protein [Paraburkholderia sediminicola]|uniref:hypothetical protein n=1 Tax=Paraburkholderia sediminicola TaxID=458836 RepID=UPI0038BC3F6A
MNVFSVDRLYELFDELGVPPAARMRIIDSFRRPARDLQPNRAHAPMDMPCPKMEMTIHVANAIERAAANDYLFDDDVLGYLDSPFELNIKYMGRGGKVVRFNWSQGFLVITSSRIYLDEWFTLDSLNKKCKRNPTRYQREDTVFRCPPLEEAASKLGITYRIRIAEEIDVTTVRNRNFLRSYLVDRESAPSSFIREVEAYFNGVSFTTLEELQEALPKYKLDDFHVALAEGRIAADFSSAFVCEKHRFMVFRDIESREVYRDAYQLERRLPAMTRLGLESEHRLWISMFFNGGGNRSAFFLPTAPRIDAVYARSHRRSGTSCRANVAIFRRPTRTVGPGFEASQEMRRKWKP